MARATKIYGDWCCERTLGSGGFGIVQLWQNVCTYQRIALKTCKWDDSQLTLRQKERWINEVEIMNRLDHPNIVKTLCVPTELKKLEVFLPALCMEYCSRGDLRTVLNQSENCCGITEPQALCIMSCVASAVEYLHCRNITHRDLKPENIVLQERNGKIIYKLIDLGYAKELGEASACASIVGTLNYLAPELLWKEKYSCSVDYWTLGVLFYEILTGTRPFLPNMQHTMTWMNHVKNKAYEEICAYELDGNVVFGTDIDRPTDLSECIRSKVVEWFRLVLQWDPKKRGKFPNFGGKLQIAVFKFLRVILSRKILYVFCVPLYQIFSYDVDENTTVEALQCRIQEDTQIFINQQTLTDSVGKVLNVKKALILTQIQDPVLTLFQSGSVSIDNIPPPNMPISVKKMIEQPKQCMLPTQYEKLKQYYSTTIFFMKQEVKLFRCYIIALSIKVDLMNLRFNVLHGDLQKVVASTTSLATEVEPMSQSINNNITVGEQKQKIERFIKKVHNVVEAVCQVKSKVKTLSKINENLKTFAEVDWTKDYIELYDKALNLFESLKSENRRNTDQPIQMVKLVFQFLKLRDTQIQDPRICEISKQILLLEEELLKLDEFFNSVTMLTAIYRQEFQTLQRSTLSNSVDLRTVPQEKVAESTDKSSNCSMPNSTTIGLMPTDDNVIYDNLVIRYMIHDFMTEMHKKYLEIISLNP